MVNDMRKQSRVILLFLILSTFLFGCKISDRLSSHISDEKSGMLSNFENVKVWDIFPETGFDISLSEEHVTEGKHSFAQGAARC